MSPAVETFELTKVYGSVRALDGLTMTVPRDRIVGLLGPNGAGKTTTLRVLLGLAHPTSGTARVLGTDTRSARQQIGFLPDVPGFHPWMTAPEWLQFAGRLFGLPESVINKRSAALLDQVGLTTSRRIGTFSRGMKQRLGIAQALINAPDLLILDEPTSALDPHGRMDILNLIAALRGRTTVLFSTHLLADAERVCDQLVIVDQGKVVASGTVAELRHARSGAGTLFDLDFTGPADQLTQRLSAEHWCSGCELTPTGAVITASDVTAARIRIPAVLAESGMGLVRFEEREASLEDVFAHLVGPR